MWHVLALALGGRTIREWQQVMTQAEFDAWVEYYVKHPFDDFHRHYRPAALVARSMSGGDMNELLEWLSPPEYIASGEYSAADIATFKALGAKPPSKGA